MDFRMDFGMDFGMDFFLVVFLGRNLIAKIHSEIHPAWHLGFHLGFHLGSHLGCHWDFHVVCHPGPSGKCVGSSWAPSSGTHMPDDRGNKQSHMQTNKQESNENLLGKPRYPLPTAHRSRH